MTEFTVDTCREEDIDEVSAIYDTEFKEGLGARYTEVMADFLHGCRNGQVLVTRTGEQLVGFGRLKRMCDSNTLEETYRRWLTFCADKTGVQEYIEKLEKKKNDGGKTPAYCTIYDNIATQTLRGVKPDDTFFLDAVVKREFRGRGAGIANARKRMELVRERGSELIIVDCWSDVARGIYENKLGFYPLVTHGPLRADGSGNTKMAYLL